MFHFINIIFEAFLKSSCIASTTSLQFMTSVTCQRRTFNCFETIYSWKIHIIWLLGCMWVAPVNLVNLKFCPEDKMLMKYSSMLETEFIKTKASLVIFQITFFPLLKCPIELLLLSQVVQMELISTANGINSNTAFLFYSFWKTQNFFLSKLAKQRNAKPECPVMN